MKYLTRRDSPTADALTQWQSANSLHPDGHAWTYMRRNSGPLSFEQLMSERTASRAGPRRRACPLHYPSNVRLAAPTPRRNVELALIVDKAIQLKIERGRHYAEAFLRIYPVDTALVMRVLFDIRHRRPVA
jgi:hypothetical protein